MDYSLGNIKIDKNSAPEFLQSRLLLYCAVGLLVLKILAVALFVNFPPNIFFADITKTALVDFVNQARRDSGLQILTENNQLDQAARLKAEDMVQKQYFSHISPQGISPWYWLRTIGYNYKYAGENLAIGFFDSKEVYEAWLDSPSHKANLLNSNYKEIGTAVLNGFGQNNTVVVVQLFGAPKNSAPAPINSVEDEKETEAAIAPENEILVPEDGEQVLSQSVESSASVEKPQNTFTLYNYGELLQSIVYGFLLITIGALMLAIFFSIPVKKQLVLRSSLIIVLLSFAALLNREAMILIVPHQIII